MRRPFMKNDNGLIIADYSQMSISNSIDANYTIYSLQGLACMEPLTTRSRQSTPVGGIDGCAQLEQSSILRMHKRLIDCLHYTDHA